MAEALYRKYRPQVFEDVVGQEPIERTLKNAIANDKVSHAYLFCGPRGTGKTTTARLLAKALLCHKGPTPDPDGTCEDCELIAEGAHPDVYELDAASRTGVENVREEIISRVQFAPTRGKSKVYIIDEVHMLSTPAFNALLKTLEEPPSHVVFILCTTDPHKVPETIHSRCQRFDFHRISPESMVARLGAICIAEDVEFEGEALDLIAQRAEGGLRNALTSLEQIIAFEDGKVTLAGAERLLGAIDSNDLVEILSYIGKRDIANCFRWTAGFVETGVDLAQFVRDMAEHVRDLYVMALVGDDADLEVSETCRQQLVSELAWFGPDRASRLLGVLGDLMAELKTTSNPRLAFEVALTRMVRPDSDLTLEALAERVEALESGYSAVAHVLPGEPVAVASAAVAAAEGGLSAADPSAGASPRGLRSEAAQPSLRPQGDTPAVSAEVAGRVAQMPPEAEPASDAGGAEVPGGGDKGGGPVADSRFAALSNPAALQRVWQAALGTVKKQKQAHGVLFMNTKVLFDEREGTLRIVFPAESGFAFNAAQKPDVQDAVQEALAKAVGEPVPFRYEQGADGQQAPAPARRAEPQPQPQAVPATRWDLAPEPQPQPAPEPAPQAQVAAGPQAAPETQLHAAPEPARQPQPEPAPVPDAPYEQVPYDDVAYEPVPYDEYEPAPAPEPVPAPKPAAAPQAAPDPAPPATADAGTGASPAEPNLTPDGAIVEDTAALQAMLQASFGNGVVLDEIPD